MLTKMKRNNISKIIMSLVLVILCFAVQAQVMIKGVVTDTKNEPLVGVSIIIKGTTTGTVTNQNGEFSLNIPDNARKEIEVRYIGFETQTIAIGKSTQLNIVIKETAQEIDEVVVVGYGTMRKSDDRFSLIG
jgi:uncharacterized membrane protein